MVEELNNIIIEETKALEELLKLLEEQNKYILESRLIEMESVVPKIESCNRRVAELEMKRRGLTNGEPMSKIINNLGNEEIEENYRRIKRIIEEAVVQKDLNIAQISQGLNFTHRMLNILNPDREIKTYNSYGKIKK